MVLVVKSEPPQAVQRPVKDPSELGVKCRLQLVVFLAEPRARREQQHEAADDGTGCVTESGQFVGNEMQPNGELAAPLIPVLAIYGERVFAADREQALDDNAAILAAT